MNWPAHVSIPKSFNEALRSGWRIGRVGGRGQGIQLFIYKTVSQRRLRLSVPYQLIDRYLSPRDPQARRLAVSR